jgi:hypothetical protein
MLTIERIDIMDILDRAQQLCMDLRAREFAYKDHPNAGELVNVSEMAGDAANMIEELVGHFMTKE